MVYKYLFGTCLEYITISQITYCVVNLGKMYIVLYFLFRKIAIIEFATKSRQQFVRLLALVKWAASAERVDKCQVCWRITVNINLLNRYWRHALLHLPGFGKYILIGQEDNCTAILEINKSLGSADIFLAELARVKKKHLHSRQFLLVTHMIHSIFNKVMSIHSD